MQTSSNITVEYAGATSRILAVLLDSILLGFVSFLVFSFNSSGLVTLLFLFLTFAYFTAFEGQWGQTLGKKVLSIKVVAEDGSQLTMGKAAIRNILRGIDVLGPFFPYFIGYVVMLFSKKNQRIGDMAAKSVVVSA